MSAKPQWKLDMERRETEGAARRAANAAAKASKVASVVAGSTDSHQESISVGMREESEEIELEEDRITEHVSRFMDKARAQGHTGQPVAKRVADDPFQLPDAAEDAGEPFLEAMASELTLLRKDPAAYAVVLEHMAAVVSAGQFRSVASGRAVPLEESQAEAFAEAAGFMRALDGGEPLVALARDAALDRTAELFVERGQLAAPLSSRPERLATAGANGPVKEMLYPSTGLSARETLGLLLADDGAPKRSRRKQLLSTKYSAFGMATGPIRSTEEGNSQSTHQMTLLILR